jgi:hypothetical protein
MERPMIGWDEVQAILDRHDLRRKVAAATPVEGLVLGNADMGTVIFGPAHRLCLRLNKQNLWDSRWNAACYQEPLPLSRLKEYVHAHSAAPTQGASPSIEVPGNWGREQRLYPCMRSGADLLVRVSQVEPGYILPNFTQRLRIADGMYIAQFPNPWRPPGPYLTCEAFVSWQCNVLAVRIHVPDYWADRHRTVVSLWRDPWGGRSWELLSAGASLRDQTEVDFRRDPRADALPPAELTLRDGAAELWQVIPGDDWFPGNDFAIAATPGNRELSFFREPSGYLSLELLDRNELTLFVGMANALEGPAERERARQLSRDACARGWDALYADHAAAWRAFWTASVVEVDDAALQKRWVMGSFEMASTVRSGRPAPALYGVATPHDGPPWKGDRHNNYPEFSSRFWGAFNGNHPEQALAYTEFVHGYLPTARRIARDIFECETGAAYPALYFDGTTRYHFHRTWSHALYLSALHAQNCWFHYQFFGDADFLRRLAYPVMQECAAFYETMLAKNEAGDYSLWPTVVSELHGWTPHFERNRNSIEDIAHLKFLLRAMLEASAILGLDSDRRPRWREILARLPPYPTVTVDGAAEFTDVEGEKERQAYNIQVQLCPLWPAEDPDAVSDPRLRAIAERTLRAVPNPYAHDRVRRIVGLVRLGLPELLWPEVLGQTMPDGEDSNASCHDSQGYPFPINEMLMTSWDGVIRLFPGWPLARRARFASLRAKGAFLVSAACADGCITTVTIRSERGGLVRLQVPWPDARVVAPGGEDVLVSREGAIWSWETAPGGVYFVRAEPGANAGESRA